MDAPSTDSELIQALGGYKTVAVLLGIKPNIVWNWEKRPHGVSADWRPSVAAVARRKRIKLPPNFLEPAARRKVAA